jgi:hypothetical protein
MYYLYGLVFGGFFFNNDPVPPYRVDQTSFNGSILTPVCARGNPIVLSKMKEQVFRVFCSTNWPSGFFYCNSGIRDVMRSVSLICYIVSRPNIVQHMLLSRRASIVK